MYKKKIEEYLKNDSIIDVMFKERNEIVEEFLIDTKEQSDLIKKFGQMEDKLSEYGEILDLLYGLDEAYKYASEEAKKVIYIAGVHDGIALKL